MDLEGLPMLCEGGVADNTTVEEVKFADSEGVKVADKPIGGDVEEGCDGEDFEEGSDGGDVEEGSDGEEGFDGEEDSSDSENTTKRILLRNKDEPYGYDDPDYEGNQRDVYINYRRQYKESDGANLILLDIIKANRESVALYHITFKAEDVSLGEVKVYQTRVFHSLVPGHKETVVHIFRLKEPTNKDDKTD
uniref:Cystatin domain-containing protein n=1 Tax=Manihot esculenta TaxID=3983 RepID=A0A2C9UXH3_MANES